MTTVHVHTPHHKPNAHMARGPSKVLLFGTLVFIAIATYVAVVTHHLKIDMHGVHLEVHPNAVGASSHSGIASIARRKPVDPEAAAAFVARMQKLGAFEKYDKDKNGAWSSVEFAEFLQDLAKSRILDPMALQNHHGTAADLVVKTSKAQAAAQKAAGSAPQGTGASAAAAEAKPSTTATKTEGPASTAVATTVTPGGECPALSRELVESFAVDKTIMLTVSDWRIFETFGRSWMKHLARIKVDYYLVGATDQMTAAYLASQGRHPCFKFFEDGHGHGTQKEYKYGDVHYNAATWRKVTVVQQIVSWGFNVIHSDVDVVWFRDPKPYFLGESIAEADVIVSTDLVSTQNPVGDEGMEVGIHQHVNLNTGVYFVKATPGGQLFMEQWAGLRKNAGGDNDQFGLYKWVRGRPANVEHTKRVLNIRVDEGKWVKMGLLSVAMLLNGYSYFIPRLNIVNKVPAVGIHLTWVPLSREGKFHRMRDGMLYNDEPEYYNGPLFITAELEKVPVPDGYNSWKDTEEMIKFHLQAMDKQLVQVYRVMAAAVMLNRTLVLPKMQCFCYKNWFMMEQCRIPGDKATVFPMECQLDQWLRPKVLYNYGPNIVGSDGVKRSFLFREHSMFDNPNFNKEVLKKRVVIEASDVTVPSMEEDKEAGTGYKMLVPKLMKQDKFVEIMKSLQDKHVVILRRPYEIVGEWTDQALKTSFEAFLDKVAGNWCCRDKPFVAKGLKEKEKLAIHW